MKVLSETKGLDMDRQVNDALRDWLKRGRKYADLAFARRVSGSRNLRPAGRGPAFPRGENRPGSSPGHHAPGVLLRLRRGRVAFQVVFLLIATDPVRYRPMMIAAILEKAGFAIAMPILYLQHRIPGLVFGFSLIDLLLGVLFAVAYVRPGFGRVPPGDEPRAALEGEEAQAHWNSTSTRLRKPIRKKMWISSQTHQARKPDSRLGEGRDARPAADRRERALVAGSGTARAARRASARRMFRAAWRPSCIAAGATPGTGLPSCSSVARSPITKTSRVPGHGQVGLDADAPGAVERHAERSSRAARPRRRRPRGRCGASDPLVPERDAVGVDAGDARAGADLDAEALELRRAPSRKRSSGKGGSTRGPPSSRRMRALARVDVAEVPRSAWRAISASAPASSTPVGPPPTTTKVSQRSPRGDPARARPPRRRAGRGGGSRARPRCS